jgi:signal peptidase I
MFYIFFAVKAFYTSKKTQTYELKKYNKLIFYTIWPIIFFGSSFVFSASNSLSAFRIPTSAMENSLKVSDFIFAEMEYYKNISRNDIVIFNSPKDDNLSIKRVIGLGGEKISMDKGRIYINGKFHKENNPNIIIDSLSNYSNFDEILIPVNHFFVMGDNRGNSRDSRMFGPIDKSQIIGKPLYIYYSETCNRIGRKIK